MGKVLTYPLLIHQTLGSVPGGLLASSPSCSYMQSRTGFAAAVQSQVRMASMTALALSIVASFSLSFRNSRKLTDKPMQSSLLNCGRWAGVTLREVLLLVWLCWLWSFFSL